MSKVIEVKSCGECPFYRGVIFCYIDDSLLNLPNDQVHKNCPLKKESVTVKIKE